MQIVGNSEKIQKSLSKVYEAAKSNMPVLISGEIGTGKRLFALEIHKNGPLRDRPFRIYDESEEINPFSNYFEHNILKVNGGTLLFHEIDSLSTSIQKALASYLFCHEDPFNREKIRNPFRMIATTTQSIQDIVSRDKILEELHQFYEFKIHLIPLRERINDVEDIANYHLKQLCANKDLTLKELDPNFISALKKHDWPHNVKELIQVLEASVHNSGKARRLRVEHLPPHIFYHVKQFSHPKTSPIEVPQSLLKELETSDHMFEEKRSVGGVNSPAKRALDDQFPKPTDTNEKSTIVHEQMKKTTRLTVCFYQNGDFWTIGPIGHQTSIEGILGMKMIHYLLENPDEKKSSLEVYYVAKGYPPIDIKTEFKEIRKDEDSENGALNIRKSIDEKIYKSGMSNLTKSQIKSLIEHLKKEIHVMESGTLDPDELLEKQEQLKMLTEYLKQNNQPDRTSQDEKSRTNVQKAIKRAIENTIREVPQMKKYFEKIKPGYDCRYIVDDKETEPKWILYKKQHDNLA